MSTPAVTASSLASPSLRDEMITTLVEGLHHYVTPRPAAADQVWTLLLTEGRGFSFALRSWDLLNKICRGCPTVAESRARASQRSTPFKVVVLARCDDAACLWPHANLLIADEEAEPTRPAGVN